MKKAIAILLALVIAAGCCAFTASASEKVPAFVQQILDQMTDSDTMRVYFRLCKPNLDYEEIEALAYERTGIPHDKKLFSEESDQIRLECLIITYELYEQEAQRVADELGIPGDRIVDITGLAVAADMNKAEIAAAYSMKGNGGYYVSPDDYRLPGVAAIVCGNGAAVKKLSPALKELMDNASEGDTVDVQISYDEAPKTIDEMPSWPDGSRAVSELTEFYEYHNLMKALDLLGLDYIDMILELNDYFNYPYQVFPYYYYLGCGLPGGVSAEKVPVEALPRIASDSRVKAVKLIDEQSGTELENVLAVVDSDDYVSVWIDYNGYVKNRGDFPSEEDYSAYIASIRDNLYGEVFAEVEPVIVMGFDEYFHFVVAAVRARDVGKLPVGGSARSVSYFSNPAVRQETGGSFVAKTNYFYEFDEEYGYDKDIYTSYKELCHHTDRNGEVDWALLRVVSRLESPMSFHQVIGNRVVFKGGWRYPFSSDYAVYDVHKRRFLPLSSYLVTQYNGLGRIYDQIGEGRLLGDIDGDDDLTAVDCTLMQRCVTRLRDWPQDDEIPKEYGFDDLIYYSDFDRDGERDIVDTTKLQRYVTMID